MCKIGNYKISQNLAHTHTVLPPPLTKCTKKEKLRRKDVSSFFGIFRDFPSYIRLFDLYLLN